MATVAGHDVLEFSATATTASREPPPWSFYMGANMHDPTFRTPVEASTSSSSRPRGQSPMTIGVAQQCGEPQDVEVIVEEEGAPVEPDGRLCLVCMSKNIATVALPCRHSTMCSACCAEVQTRHGKCPLCRVRIDFVLEGEFDEEYVDVGYFFVEKYRMQYNARKAAFYETAYEKIWCMIGSGVAAGFASAIFIFSAWLLDLVGESMILYKIGCLVAGTFFALYAICNGYLPWFAVTLDTFERDQERRMNGLFTQASLSEPMTSCAKLLVLVVAVPFFFVFFIVPYFVVAVIVRPFCYTYGARVATCACRCLCCFSLAFYSCLLVPCGNLLNLLRACMNGFKRLLCMCCKKFWCSLVPCCSFLNQCCCTPCCVCAEACCVNLDVCTDSIGRCISRATTKCTRAICSIFAPCWVPLKQAVIACWTTLTTTVEALWEACCTWLAGIISIPRKCIVRCCTSCYQNVIWPIGQRVLQVLKSVFQWLRGIVVEVGRTIYGR